MNRDKVYEDTWKDQKNERLPYLKNDVLSTAFSYARYLKRMEELTGIGMQNSLTLLSLANNFFNGLRDENGEPIYTYNDEWTRYFVPKRVTGGRCSALNQYYKSVISDKIFKIFSKQLSVNGNVCEIVDKYFESTIKHRKIIEDEYDSHFEDYRERIEDEKSKHIKLSRKTIHEKIQKKLNLSNVMMDFDATSFYSFAMYDEKSLYPEIETVFAFKPHMIDVYVNSFNDQTFNQDGDESASLKVIFQTTWSYVPTLTSWRKR